MLYPLFLFVKCVCIASFTNDSRGLFDTHTVKIEIKKITEPVNRKEEISGNILDVFKKYVK